MGSHIKRETAPPFSPEGSPKAGPEPGMTAVLTAVPQYWTGADERTAAGRHYSPGGERSGLTSFRRRGYDGLTRQTGRTKGRGPRGRKPGTGLRARGPVSDTGRAYSPAHAEPAAGCPAGDTGAGPGRGGRGGGHGDAGAPPS